MKPYLSDLSLKLKSIQLKPTGMAGFLLAVAIPIFYFFQVFTLEFLLGTSNFWQHTTEDVTQAVSGITAFRHEPWQFPLLKISSINWPSGTYITFVGENPLFATLVKVFNPIFPEMPLGIWIFACFLLMGIAAWWAAKQARITKWHSLLIILAFCVLMPALTQRIGHVALMSQFLIVFGLGCYFRDRCKDKESHYVWALIIFASFYVNLYIAAMVITLYAASTADILILRKNGLFSKNLLAPLPLLISIPFTYGKGLFAEGLFEAGFSVYSMNLLAPFSGGGFISLPWYADGTTGQYEGFNYLGIGLLLGLFLFCVPSSTRKSRFGPAVKIAFAGLILYSLSNEIYLSNIKILEWKIPTLLKPLTATFRVPGRFFWPIAYAGVFALSLNLDRFRLFKGLFIAGILLSLQWYDLSAFRFGMMQYANREPIVLTRSAKWETLLQNVDTVYYYPKFWCGGYKPLLAMQLVTARLQKNISTGYISRIKPDCNSFEEDVVTADLEKSVFVYSMEDFEYEEVVKLSPVEFECKPIDQWYLCGEQWGRR